MSSGKQLGLGFTEILYLIIVWLWTVFWVLLSTVGTDQAEQKPVFAIIFCLGIGVMLSLIPFVFYRKPSIEGWISVRMDLPKQKDKVTFPVLASFLSEQALASFIGTTLVSISGYLFRNEYRIWSLIVAFLLLGASLTLITLSTYRFSCFFRDEDRKIGFIPALSVALVVTIFVYITKMLNQILALPS